MGQRVAAPLSDLLAVIREDRRTHGGWSEPGFRALAVHRFGNWRMTIGSKWLRAPVSVTYRIMYRRMRNYYGIELPWSTVIGRRVAFHHQGGIVINGATVIGDDCIIRHNSTMGIRRLDDLGCPRLGVGVNVGVGAVLLGPISIGDGASIGANAVVIHDVPAGCTVAGNPARIIRRPEGITGLDEPQG
jgi:serine O-acetyltransferase